MKRIVSIVLLAAFVFGSGVLWATDKVYFQEPGKKKFEIAEGKIVAESPSGLKIAIKAGTKDIPTTQILRVEYDSSVGRLTFSNPDVKRENASKAGAKAVDKAKGLSDALFGYQTLANDDKLTGIAPIQRYLRYRIAQTMALQALDDSTKRDAAIAALVEYKSKFADGWEIVPALQTLASLQVDKGDADAAAQTYSALAEVSGIAPEMKLHGQLQASRLLLRAGKFADAERTLRQVETRLSANDPQRTFVSVYLIQAHIAQKGNLDGIDKKLEQVVRTTKDTSLLALAHNALGDYYRAKKDDERAFWEYCKVDLLYDRDKEEHAKALYNLSKLFGRAPRNDLDRAKECLTRLKSSAFDGTLYQRLTAAEKKGE